MPFFKKSNTSIATATKTDEEQPKPEFRMPFIPEAIAAWLAHYLEINAEDLIVETYNSPDCIWDHIVAVFWPYPDEPERTPRFAFVTSYYSRGVKALTEDQMNELLEGLKLANQ